MVAGTLSTDRVPFAPRDHGKPMAVVLALVLLLLGAGQARSAEREFPTIVALGLAKPIGTTEGLSTPIIVVDHEQENPWGKGTLAVNLKTSILLARLTHPITRAFGAEYRWRSEVVSEGDGLDLYSNGKRLGSQSFEGDSTAFVAAGQLFPQSLWGAALELERQDTRFRPSGDAGPDFDAPPGFHQNAARLIFERRRTLGEEEGKLSLTLTVARREGWGAWSLDQAPEKTGDFQRQELRWHQPVQWAEGHRSEATLGALSGRDLDLISGFRVGGIAGRYPLPGYFRNEFRARRALLLNLSHEWAWQKDRVLTLYGDAARLDELELQAAGTGGKTRHVGSLGLGFRYGIRALGGLPVILRYGQGLNVPAEFRERQRREVMVAVAAGF